MLLLAASAFVAILETVPVANNDIWLHLKIGQLVLETGRLPGTLLFPFTSAQDFPFHAHEWLSSVVLFASARVLGENGLMLLQGSLALGQFWLVRLLARRLGNGPGASTGLALLAMVLSNYRAVLRPEMLALLLLIALLLVLSLHRRSPRGVTLAWVIPIGILWANIQGSAVLGPAVLALWALGEAITAARRAPPRPWSTRVRAGMRTGVAYAGATGLMTLATCVNPQGPGILRFALDVRSSDVMRVLIKEWLPTFHPLFVAEPAFATFAVLGVASAALLVGLRRQLTATELLLWLVFLALALNRNRFIVWFAFVDLWACASVLGRWRGAQAADPGLRAVSLAVAMAGIVWCAVIGNVRGASLRFAPSNDLGPAMTQALAQAEVRGNVYNSYELGAELIWRDWPRIRPVIDSRIDSYGSDYFLYMQGLLSDEAQLQAFLAAGKVNFMVLLARDFQSGVRQMPHMRLSWHIRTTDGRILVLERNQPL